MIPFANRFHRRNAIKYIYARGEVFRSRFVTLKVLKQKSDKITETRAVVVISKKTLKSAVRRNLLRRRIYSILEKEISKLNSKYDIVFIVSLSEIISINHEELVSVITGLLKEADMY
jgi:ribonuclease P protein component